MRNEGSLRGRIVAAHALLATAVCVFFALVGLFAAQRAENFAVEWRLAPIADWYLDRLARGVEAGLPPGIVFYKGAGLPQRLQALKPGFHEAAEGGGNGHVLIGRAADGERYAVEDRVTDFDRIEREVLIVLGLGIGASVLLATLLGRLTAGRVVAPLTALARAVKADELAAGSALLLRDDEIGVLGRAFAARAAELQGFLVRERLFVGDVSHELRTPLTVILGASDVLSLHLGDRPELTPVVQRIQRTAHETADRVSALLMLSRSPEALASAPSALLPIVEREIERCKPLLVGKQLDIELQAQQAPWAAANADLVAMAIGNLLRNACMYTERGRITVRLAAQSLQIEDTGPGLPAAVRAQIFERLARGTPGSQGGAGLGLAIVKRIVEHLGWQIGLDTPAGGSRFTLTFPGTMAPP